MKALRILLTIAAVVAIAIVAMPDASANCGQNKFFRSGGMDSTDNVRLSPGYAGQAPGTEIGRWWDSANFNLSSNFGPNAGTCPSGGWWFALGNGNMYIDGILDGPGCVGYAGCPGLEMSVAVEDYGPPGDDSALQAYMVCWRVDDTPANLRRYDYGRTDNGVPGNSTFPFVAYPPVDINASVRNPPNIIGINYTVPNAGPWVHTAFGSGDAALPLQACVAEWQLLASIGAQPTRDRNTWNLGVIQSGDPNGQTQNVDVDCGDGSQSIWLGIGAGFDGGTGVIPSELVGEAIELECDPNLADPDDVFKQVGPRPSGDVPLQAAPRSSGGRR